MSIKPISDFLDLFEGLNPCKSRMVGSPSPQTESKCMKKKKKKIEREGLHVFEEEA